jgi:hypothetical protein
MCTTLSGPVTPYIVDIWPIESIILGREMNWVGEVKKALAIDC